MRCPFTRPGVVVILAVLVSGIGSGEAPKGHPEGRLHFHVYDDQAGLPQNTGRALARDENGFIWIGTSEGVARFDGHTFTPLEMPGSEFFRNVIALMTDGPDSLWIATAGGGLLHYQGGRFTTHDVNTGLPSNWPVVLARTEDGVIWAGTDSGLARFARGFWTVLGTEAGLPSNRITSLFASRDERGPVLWVGTDKGLALVDTGGHAQPLPPGMPVFPVSSVFARYGPGTGHEIWIAGQGRVARLRNGSVTVFGAADGLPDAPVRAFAEVCPKGGLPEIWCGTYGRGIVRFRADVIDVIDAGRGLPDNFVWDILALGASEAGVPMVLAGFSSRGLGIHVPGLFTAFDKSSGLPDNNILSIFDSAGKDGQHDLWIGTVRGLARFSNGRWSVFDRGSGLPSEVVYSMLEIPAGWRGEGTLLAATARGIARLAGQRWLLEETVPELSGQSTLTLKLDTYREQPVIWAAGGQGVVFRGREGPWSRLTIPGGSDAEGVLTSRNSPGQVWVTSRRGLVRVRGEASPVESVHNLPKAAVFQILMSDARGLAGLWAASIGGLIRIDEDQLCVEEILSTKSQPPLPNSIVNHVRQDASGRLYALTNRGVARISPRSPTAEDLSRYKVRNFSVEDGLPASEGNRGASLVDTGGRIWVGTVGGAAVLDPDLVPEDTLSKPLHVVSASAGDRNGKPGEELVVNHKDGAVRVTFSLVSLFRPRDVRYRTQIEGLEASPTEWSPRASRDLERLPPGRFRLLVWARDHAGNQTGPVLVAMRVFPAPWKTPQAYTAFALAALSLVYAFHRVRLRVIRQRTVELEETVEERTKALRLSNEELATAKEKLEKAQAQLSRLQESAGVELIDTERWAKSTAADVARAIGAGDIGVFLFRNQGFVPLSSDSAGMTAPEIGEHALLTESLGRDGSVVIPVHGMTAEVRGALVVRNPPAAFGEAERRVVRGFAQHLGSALDLQFLKNQLIDAENRRMSARRQMHERGIETISICPKCRSCYGPGMRSCPADGTVLQENVLLPYRVGGRYRLLRLLGEGGMGTVFKAADERLGRDVAVKILNPQHLTDAALRFRLEREAQTIARIHHPGVVALFDTGELDDGSAYLVMEYLQGSDLAELLSSQGAGTPRQVASLLRQSASALAAAHSQKIIHRDIKPANVFLSPSGDGFHVKILDFGLARSTSLDSHLTRTGIVVGTPAYMSPEQVRGEHVDERSDLYSLAAVIFEALTGHPIVLGTDVVRILMDVAQEKPPSVSFFIPSIPGEIDAAFDVAFCKDPAQRPASLELWADHLVHILQTISSSEWPGWVTGRTRK